MRKKRSIRRAGLFLLALQVVAGGFLSLVLVLSGLLVTLVLGATNWFKEDPRRLKVGWYALLLTAGGVMYFVPAARARSPVKSCEDLGGPVQAFLQRADDSHTQRGSASLSAHEALIADVDREGIRLRGQAAEILSARALMNQARRTAQTVAITDSKRSADLEAAANRLSAVLDAFKDDETIAKRGNALDEQLKSLRRQASEAQDTTIPSLRRDLERVISDVSFDAGYTSMTSVKSLLNDVVRAHAGLVADLPVYSVRLDSAQNRLVYEERVHLHVTDGDIEQLDLSEFDLASRGNVTAMPHIRLSSREMTERMVAASELADVRLKERPRDLTIINEMWTSPGETPTCRGIMWFAFQGALFIWPQPFDIEVRGLARLPLSATPVQFVAPVSKNIRVSELRLPMFALFSSNATLTKKGADLEIEDKRYDVYAPPDASAEVNRLRIRSELLPKQSIFRNKWVSENRDLFFPVGWLLALPYLLLSSIVSEVLFKKPE